MADDQFTLRSGTGYPDIGADPAPTPDPAPSKKDSDSDTSGADLSEAIKEEKNLIQMQRDYLQQSQARDQAEDARARPFYEAALKQAAQPLPQPPSMTEASPYGPPPDPQSQRQGIVGGIMYGLLGLGLAKIFAGKNKYAYWGAVEGLGQALQQRNANQKEAAQESFDRWLKLNTLWHQQLEDRYKDYTAQLENSRLTEAQKMDMIRIIAEQHGNMQTAAAARMEGLEKVSSHIEHLGKLIEAQQAAAHKVQDEWLKRQGNSEAEIAYRSFLIGKGYDPEDRKSWNEAQLTHSDNENNPNDVSFYTWQKKGLRFRASLRPGSTPAPAPGEAGKEDQEKEIQEHVKSIIGGEKPAAPETAVTPSSGYPATGLLPAQ